jgi:hypothetical protein
MVIPDSWASASSNNPGGMLTTFLSSPIVGEVLATGGMLMADYELFSQTEQETENSSTMGGVMTALSGAAALFATMYWLQKTFGLGRFHLFPHGPHDPQFWLCLAVAGAIVAAIVAAAVIAGTLGNSGPTNPTASAISSAASPTTRWYSALSSTSVGFLAAGVALGGMGNNLIPGNITQFSVPTVQLNEAVAASGSPNANILVQKATTPTGSDTVYMIEPGAGPNGTSEVTAFRVDPKGYLVSNDAPASANIYKPFVTPNANGAGYTTNKGAFEALYQDPGCIAVANDTSLTVNEREAALETCGRNNKNVQLIPTSGGS